MLSCKQTEKEMVAVGLKNGSAIHDSTPVRNEFVEAQDEEVVVFLFFFFLSLSFPSLSHENGLEEK